MYEYEVVAVHRTGHEHHLRLRTERPLGEGELLPLERRHWLVERIGPPSEAGLPRVTAKPARYRLVLCHSDGREEAGDVRDWAEDAPDFGFVFATVEHGEQVSWQVVGRRLARDAEGELLLELTAERDYAELQ